MSSELHRSRRKVADETIYTSSIVCYLGQRGNADVT